MIEQFPFVDPESFDNYPFFVLFFSSERWPEQIPLQAGHHHHHHLNCILQASRWWPNFVCWQGSFLIFRGSGPILPRNPILLWFFRGGVRTSCPHSGSVHGFRCSPMACHLEHLFLSVSLLRILGVFKSKLFYPVTGRNEHACMLLIYLLVKLYELQERW